MYEENIRDLAKKAVFNSFSTLHQTTDGEVIE
jgi:hypothetical protein